MISVKKRVIIPGDKAPAGPRPRSSSTFNQGSLRRLAYERPALVLYLAGRDQTSTGGHATVTMFLTSLVELEKRKYIDLTPSFSTWGRHHIDGVWVTKRAPQVPGTGVVIELFKCIPHVPSPVQEIVRRYLRSFPQDPWTLARRIGEKEAISYGYIYRQTWPKSGLKAWLAQLGLGTDTQTVWAQNGVKVKAARQASLILREQLAEFRRRAPQLYRGLRREIIDGMASTEAATSHPTIRLPHLIKRHAH